MIRKALVISVIVYIAVSAVQIFERPSTAPEGILICSALIAAASFYYVSEKDKLRAWEGAALWGAVSLFVLYGILNYAGVL
ncbi:MAG TPA: hypothetical protein HA256_08760 [Methanoregulaceae archaeon]|jgi:hypothetical protein|nr:hypothetical protein [Methanoregulaceae archaeon]